LETALAAQAASEKPLGEILIAQGFSSRPAIQDALAEQAGVLFEPERGFGTGLRGLLARKHRQRKETDAPARPQLAVVPPLPRPPAAPRPPGPGRGGPARPPAGAAPPDPPAPAPTVNLLRPIEQPAPAPQLVPPPPTVSAPPPPVSASAPPAMPVKPPTVSAP